MVSCRLRRTICRPALGAGLLGMLLLTPGCHNAADDRGLPPAVGFRPTPDTPGALPPAPALFTAVLAPGAPPEQQVSRPARPTPDRWPTRPPRPRPRRRARRRTPA